MHTCAHPFVSYVTFVTRWRQSLNIGQVLKKSSRRRKKKEGKSRSKNSLNHQRIKNLHWFHFFWESGKKTEQLRIHQLFLSNKINNGPMYVCCCCCSTNCVVVVKKAAKNPEKKRDSFLLQLFPSHYDFTIILIQMYFSRKTFLKAKHVYWNTFEINYFNQLIFK